MQSRTQGARSSSAAHRRVMYRREMDERVSDGRSPALKLRREQRHAFEAVALEAFANTMVEHLRRAFAAEVRAMDDAQLRDFIVAGVEKAERYEVVVAADVARFIRYMAYWGVGFDRDPRLAWVMMVLRDESLDGTAKMDALDARASR